MRSKNIQSDGSGNSAESDFVNRVLERLHKELQFYDSGTVTVEQTTRGVRFHVKPSKNANGQIVYMQACLADGSTCYVPVLVSGTIYRLPADAPGATPTINTGKVPDGTPELI